MLVSATLSKVVKEPPSDIKSERERRFVVDREPSSLSNFPSFDIRQHYVTLRRDGEIVTGRIRETEDGIVLTVKTDKLIIMEDGSTAAKHAKYGGDGSANWQDTQNGNGSNGHKTVLLPGGAPPGVNGNGANGHKIISLPNGGHKTILLPSSALPEVNGNGANGHKTILLPSGALSKDGGNMAIVKCDEEEWDLTEDILRKVMKEGPWPGLFKRRHFVYHDAGDTVHTVELDLLGGMLRGTKEVKSELPGMMIAEVELDTLGAAIDLRKAPWFGHEITGWKKMGNHSLARKGRPTELRKGKNGHLVVLGPLELAIALRA